MDEQEWRALKQDAHTGLRKALSEGRGVDALAMLEAHERICGILRNFRDVQAQLGARNALGGAPR